MASITQNPQFLFGKVMHARLIPKINKFIYGIYYLSLPLSNLESLSIPHNKWGFWSFFDKDHGPKDGNDLKTWAQNHLKNFGLDQANDEIVLICMPRILGYVFNPVSFWLCYDKDRKLRAVLCEVNNTFGETHTYICAHPDQKEIKGSDVIEGKKVFHVSPFMQRDGAYEFRFDINDNTFGVWIDYLNDEKRKRLVTSLKGDFKPLNTQMKAKAFFTYPIVTFKTIFLIHWQAFKLVLKGIKYVPKPEQIEEKSTSTKGLKKLMNR